MKDLSALCFVWYLVMFYLHHFIFINIIYVRKRVKITLDAKVIFQKTKDVKLSISETGAWLFLRLIRCL